MTIRRAAAKDKNDLVGDERPQRSGEPSPVATDAASHVGTSGHFNGLTPAEAERLAWLSEELGEAQQAIGKILRHGYASHNPVLGGDNNRENLEREVGDVQAAVNVMVAARDLDRDALNYRAVTKEATVGKWMHHQAETGNQATPPSLGSVPSEAP